MSANRNPDNGVLDLDALYGVDKPLKVLWHDREFVMRGPQAIGPRDIVALEAIQARRLDLQKLGTAMTDVQATELEEVVDQLLEIICPEMGASDAPFIARARAVAWYFEQANPRPEKKMTTRTPNARSR